MAPVTVSLGHRPRNLIATFDKFEGHCGTAHLKWRTKSCACLRRAMCEADRFCVMAGHEGGIVTFGKNLEDAFDVVMRERKESSPCI